MKTLLEKVVIHCKPSVLNIEPIKNGTRYTLSIWYTNDSDYEVNEEIYTGKSSNRGEYF